MGQKPVKSLADAPVVVVIGGGFAGVKVAKALDEHCNVVLFERKDYFLHNLGTPRGMVDTDFMKKLLIPYDQLLKNGHVVQAQVTKLSDNEVTLQGQEKAITDFKYMVIATGMSYAFPYKVPEAKQADVLPLYEGVKAKIEGAANIVCVGAGSTGLEAACEISCKWPDKKITIVHSRDKLFEGPFKPAYGAKMEEHLRRGFPNVELIKNDRLLPVEADGGEAAAQAKYVVPAGGKVVTKNGVEIPCDLLFWCVGGRHNTTSYEEHFAAAMDKGQLKVDQFLQVEGHSRVFAAGDICSAGPSGTVHFAQQHADCIVANILADMKGGAMKPYKAGPHVNITQLGTTMGAGCIPGPAGTQIVVGHKIVQAMKWDCFANKTWDNLGYKKAFEKKVGGGYGGDDTNDADRLQNVLHMNGDEIAKMMEGHVEKDEEADHT